MQIDLHINGDSFDDDLSLKIFNLNKYSDKLPKSIKINKGDLWNPVKLSFLEEISKIYDNSIMTFHNISAHSLWDGTQKSYFLSNIAKNLYIKFESNVDEADSKEFTYFN